jgi:hypothetical protein
VTGDITATTRVKGNQSKDYCTKEFQIHAEKQKNIIKKYLFERHRQPIRIMLRQIGKKYADDVANKVEELTYNALNERNPQDNTSSNSNSSSNKVLGGSNKTTEKLHKISGRRRAVFIGINYIGQKNELK